MLIPDKINNFRAYIDTPELANQIVGVTDEVTLPSFDFMSETLSLAGMAGEVDSPAVGQLQSVSIEIPFSNISKQGMKFAQSDNKMLILRAAQEMTDSETLAKSYIGREIYIRGLTKGINYGTLKKAGYGNASITKEVIYYKEILDGEVITEIDKFNGKFFINGESLAAGIDKLI